jgi:hypothetical protein
MTQEHQSATSAADERSARPSYGTVIARTSSVDLGRAPPLRINTAMASESPEGLTHAEDYSSEEEDSIEVEEDDDDIENTGVHKAEATKDVFRRASKRVLLVGCAALQHYQI